MIRGGFDPESAVLSCIIADPDAYWRIADLVAAEDFQSPKLRALWKLAVDLIRAGKPADAVSIGDVDNDLGMEALDISRSAIGTPRNVRTYAELISRRAVERRVKQAGQRIAMLSGEDALAEAQRILAACAPQNVSSVGTLAEFSSKAMRGIVDRSGAETEMTGVPTSYAALDDLTGGWQRDDLIVVAARPSVGKTAFALQAALSAAKSGTPTMFVSLEMSGKQLADRALSHTGGVNSLHIRDSKKLEDWEWPELNRAHQVHADYPFHIDESGNATVEAICARIRQVNAADRLGLVVIDYLTYIRPPKADKMADAIQEVTRSLKGLAKELHVPVILLSQLNRDGEQEPVLRNLRDSGAIEQDADVVIFLHRPDPKDRDLIKVIVGKQRNGPLGDFYLRADMTRMRFDRTEYEPVEERSQPSFSGMSRRGRTGNRAADAAAGEAV